MEQPKSKLTLVLKIYSVCVLLYAVYASVGTISSLRFESPYPLLILSAAENTLSLIPLGVFIWAIYRNKTASPLFLPCLINSVIILLTMTARAICSILTHTIMTNVSSTFWNIIFVVIFIFIAIDSKLGSKYALVELSTLAAVYIMSFLSGTLTSLIEFARFSGFSNGIGQSVLSNMIFYNTLHLLLSFSVVVILFLLRVLDLRKKESISPGVDLQ